MAGWDLDEEGGGRVVGRMRVGEEWVFEGHYPGAPILAGMCLVEAVVQLGRVRLAQEQEAEGDWRLGAISSCRFLAPVRPGDELRGELKIESGAEGAVVEATVESNGVKAAVMKLVCVSSPVPGAATGQSSAAGAGRAPADEAGEAPTGMALADETSGRQLDQAAVQRILPHRSPMLLVDGAVAVDDGRAGKPVLWAHRDVRPCEPCFAEAGGDLDPQQRFPDTLIAESFGQACGVARAVAAGRDEALAGPGRHPVIARVKQMGWSGEVVAGQRLEHRVELQASMKDGAVFSGQSFVEGRPVLQVERVVVAVSAI